MLWFAGLSHIQVIDDEVTSTAVTFKGAEGATYKA